MWLYDTDGIRRQIINNNLALQQITVWYYDIDEKTLTHSTIYRSNNTFVTDFYNTKNNITHQKIKNSSGLYFFNPNTNQIFNRQYEVNNFYFFNTSYLYDVNLPYANNL
jgi:hypothetical protein